MTDNDGLHAAAEKRLRDQTNFWRMLGGFVIVTLILIAIWWMSGQGYFWPMWAMFGMGIAALFSGWNAFGPRDRRPSEQRIQDEMKKFEQ